MPNLTIKAPAKINLHLRVGNKRLDGFHELESIFVSLDFGDTLRFEPAAANNTLEIRMESPYPMPAIPAEQNIIYRAFSLFQDRTGCTQGFRVRVEKHIPLGGGLGGGSSDAASTLLALNILGGRPLDDEALSVLAASLGSDVPFFLAETGAAWVGGRGERIKPLKSPPDLFIVLVNPGFPSETARAFRLLDESRIEITSETGRAIPERALIRALAGPPRNWPFENDFLPVFLRGRGGESGEAAAYRKILARLRELGADFAGLSGAGSTCFGVFSDSKRALRAERDLSTVWDITNVTIPLAHRAFAVLE
jgi:4-diphosphocytidyl-2-C-methyl-D-erythritol kinase